MDESRRERKKRETRQRIVAEAIALFEKQGYDQTTVAQIAAAADVDPKTFFNYFGSKDEVLFNDARRDQELLIAAIAERPPHERPGQTLARAIREYAAHRRPKVPAREAAELSAAARLVAATPSLAAKGVSVLLDLQQRIADELLSGYPHLDPVTAAAMTGAALGAIQQAGLTSVRLGRSQDDLWEATEHGLDIALRGLDSVHANESARRKGHHG